MKINKILLLFVLFIITGCVGTSSTGVFGTGVSVAIDPRTIGTQIDDSIMQKNLSAKLINMNTNYILSVKSKVLDGRIFITGKVDSVEDIEKLEEVQKNCPSAVFISCKKGEGIEALRKKIISQYENKLFYFKLQLKHSQAGLISKIRKFAFIIKEDYEEDRITLSLRLSPGGKTKLSNLLSVPETHSNR